MLFVHRFLDGFIYWRIGRLYHGCIGGFGITIRPSPVWLVVQAVVQYGLSLAMVYVLALVIEALAPNFGGERDKTKAFKVAAYSYTPGWVAGVEPLFVVGG